MPTLSAAVGEGGTEIKPADPPANKLRRLYKARRRGGRTRLGLPQPPAEVKRPHSPTGAGLSPGRARLLFAAHRGDAEAVSGLRYRLLAPPLPLSRPT